MTAGTVDRPALGNGLCKLELDVIRRPVFAGTAAVPAALRVLPGDGPPAHATSPWAEGPRPPGDAIPTSSSHQGDLHKAELLPQAINDAATSREGRDLHTRGPGDAGA